MILLELLLLNMILIDCIYFIGLTMTLYKLTGNTLRNFKVGNCLGISLHLQMPFTNQPLYMLDPNMSQSKVQSEYLFL